MQTSIGRPVDPRYPTNLAIAITAAMLFLAGLMYTWQQGAMDAGWAGQVAVAGFLAWALARELSPDHPYAAFLATAIVVGLSPIVLPSLLFSFWALLVLRILNQTPGTPTKLDGFIVIGMSLWASSSGFWIAAPVTALVFLADSKLPNPTERWKISAIPLLGLLFAWPLTFSWQTTWVRAAILFALPLMFTTVTSRCDKGTPLQSTRVQFAAILAVLLVVLEPLAGVAVAAAIAASGLWLITRPKRALP